MTTPSPFSPSCPPPQPAPEARRQVAAATALPESRSSYSVDELYDFFDFFDRTIEDVYAYVLHCTRVPELVADIMVSVYHSLLQRSRFFFWKNALQLSTVLALADKAIGSMRQWEEEATGSSYLEELLRCAWDGKERGVLEKIRLLLRALKTLPLRERKIAVLQYFLRWPASKTSSVLLKPRQSIEKEYAAVEQLLLEALQREHAFQGADVRGVLRSLTCPPLEEGRKTSLRLALLERCRTSQLSSLRFVLPVTSFFLVAGTFLGCILLLATVLLPSLSMESTLKQIAAAEVLLLGHERETRDAFLEAEHALRGIAANFAERDLALMSVQLAPPAVGKQVAQEDEVRSIIRQFGAATLGFHGLLSLEEAWAQEN